MNKFFIAVGQIAVGLVVGNVLDKVVNQGVVKPIAKLIENSKKEES